MGCKIFKIGIFFDGTNNSKKVQSEKSNIAKLHECYRELDNEGFEGKKTTSKKIYIVGIGKGEGEGNAEAATGGGGAKRINETIKKVKKLLIAHPIGVGEDDYKQHTIDVFGFSRGAATARDFVNTFNTHNKKTWKLKEVSFNFIGLYDTVGSFGIAGNDIDMKPKDPSKHSEADDFHLTSMKFDDHKNDKDYEPYNFHLSSSSAKKIIHFTATDELRHNFPLFNAKGAAQEFKLIGVHSDIGGGYGSSDRETLKMSVKLSDFRQRNALNRKGWEYQPSRSDRVYGIFEKKRIVNNDLGTVSLHLMYLKALKAKVPFDKPSDNVASSVKTYYEYVVDNLSTANSYHNAQTIKETYAHQSSTHPFWNTLPYPLRAREDSGELAGSNTVNIKNRKIERAVYPNISKKAITPV